MAPVPTCLRALYYQSIPCVSRPNSWLETTYSVAHGRSRQPSWYPIHSKWAGDPTRFQVAVLWAAGSFSARSLAYRIFLVQSAMATFWCDKSGFYLSHPVLRRPYTLCHTTTTTLEVKHIENGGRKSNIRQQRKREEEKAKERERERGNTISGLARRCDAMCRRATMTDGSILRLNSVFWMNPFCRPSRGPDSADTLALRANNPSSWIMINFAYVRKDHSTLPDFTETWSLTELDSVRPKQKWLFQEKMLGEKRKTSGLASWRINGGKKNTTAHTWSLVMGWWQLFAIVFSLFDAILFSAYWFGS